MRARSSSSLDLGFLLHRKQTVKVNTFHTSRQMSYLSLFCVFDTDFRIFLFTVFQSWQDMYCLGISETLHSVSFLFYLTQRLNGFSLPVKVTFICYCHDIFMLTLQFCWAGSRSLIVVLLFENRINWNTLSHSINADVILGSIVAEHLVAGGLYRSETTHWLQYQTALGFLWYKNVIFKCLKYSPHRSSFFMGVGKSLQN